MHSCKLLFFGSFCDCGLICAFACHFSILWPAVLILSPYHNFFFFFKRKFSLPDDDLCFFFTEGNTETERTMAVIFKGLLRRHAHTQAVDWHCQIWNHQSNKFGGFLSWVEQQNYNGNAINAARIGNKCLLVNYCHRFEAFMPFVLNVRCLKAAVGNSHHVQLMGTPVSGWLLWMLNIVTFHSSHHPIPFISLKAGCEYSVAWRWVRANKQKLNLDNREVLIIWPSSQPALNGSAFPLKKKIHILGVNQG